jgi:tetratricopeptide (TPR) repeat protein
VSDVDVHVRAIAAAGDARRANDIATGALQKGLHHPAFHAARARWFQLRDCHAEALNEFRSALALAPRDADLIDSIGMTFLRLQQPGKAIGAFDAAIRIAPAQAQIHYHKGCAHSASGKLAEALRCHERAIALQPDHADALAALAAAAARGGEAVKARRLAERALVAAPGHATAMIALAICDLHDGAFQCAGDRLDSLLLRLPPNDQTRALALGLRADSFDGQDRTERAYEAYAAKNEILQNLYDARFGGEFRILKSVEQLIAALDERAIIPVAPAAPASSPVSRHIFLLGFMRSGTTLVEQVLAAHPDVETLEERETFAGLSVPCLGGRNGLEKLSRWSEDDLRRAREIYWQRVRSFGAQPDGKIFVEKQPFNIFYLPLIAALFPSAKIVFMVRDPRDVILSCFRRHLEINSTTFELLTLTGASRYYDRVMRLVEVCRARLALDVFECRYEDLVSEFEVTTRSICRFVDMQWSDSMRAFDRVAQSRVIRSASSSQVRRGLYADGVGQWRRYKEQLSPILPSLNPWIERFRYAPQ